MEYAQYRAVVRLAEKLTAENGFIYDEFSRFRNALLWSWLARYSNVFSSAVITMTEVGNFAYLLTLLLGCHSLAAPRRR